ncbi:MAG: hypothetical protein ACYDAG_09360 [Chloroflexota bacterium]
MKTVKTVLVAQRMSDFIDVFAQWIRDAGYDVQVCTGPGGPRNECWGNTRKDCPLWNWADLAIYDPWIATAYGSASAFAIERQRHPRMPVLLWGNGAIPQDVADMARPGVVEFLPANISPRALVSQIEQMIGPPAVGIPWKVA